jgi:hypothetical protein
MVSFHAIAAWRLPSSRHVLPIFYSLSACLLGVLLFGEHIRAGAVDLAGEALAVAVVIAGAVVLSRSCLALGESRRLSCPPRHAPAGRTAEEGSPA